LVWYGRLPVFQGMRMILKNSLLLGAALVTVASLADAQQRRTPSREDLLDALTRHIQICGEMSDTQARLSCYDKLQTQVGDVQAPGPSSGPQPTPLGANPPPSSFGSNPPPPSGPPGGSTSNSSGGLAASGTPLAPPPLTTPGGGVATLGGPQGQPGTFGASPPPSPAAVDPDAAFNPSAAGTFQPGVAGPRPQPPVRRTGARPLPNFSRPMPLVTLTASNLTYGESRYWQVSIAVTSNTGNTVDTQIQCSFNNAGRSVGEAYFGPVSLAPGEQISTELIGPPTTAYVDSTNCKVLSP
jgi:hypothetical protein